MRRYYPDYGKLVKRSALMYVAFALVLILVGAGSALGAPGWVLGSVAVVDIVGFFVWFVWFGVAWTREERHRRVEAAQPSVTASERPPLTLRNMVRGVGLPWFLFSVVAMLGLPLAIVGALWHVYWLLVVGLVLLVAELVDQAIIWPARRARHRA